MVGAITAMMLLALGDPSATGWSLSETTSALDGAHSAIATLQSSNTLPNSLGRPDHALLVVRCDQGRLETYVGWPDLVGSRNFVIARWRFDDASIVDDSLKQSTDGTGTFFSPRQMASVLPGLRTAKRMVVQLTPSDAAKQEAVFELAANAEAVARVEGACR
jgi:hypothetical protein